MVKQKPATRGERAADFVANKMGSWGFVIGQSCLLVTWASVNTIVLFSSIRFDPFPFIFMNLALSAQAAFATPLLLMSQNRSGNYDRSIIQEDLKKDDETNRLVEKIAEYLGVDSDNQGH